jgi:phosphoglycerate dehydrogenase-like enzyme
VALRRTNGPISPAKCAPLATAKGRPMRILCRTPILRSQLAALAQAAGAEIVCPEDPETTLREAAAADVLWLWPAFYDRTLAAALGSSGRLRWIQLLTMGYDPLEAFGAPAGVTITNAGDAYAPTVAEHALTMLLALLRQIPAALERGAAHTWDNPGISAGVRTLIGARVAVIGFGSIGREVAARLRACGGCVIAVSESGRAHALADECANVGDLHAVLATCDAVVVAVPLTSATRRCRRAPSLSTSRAEPSSIRLRSGLHCARDGSPARDSM